MFSAASPTRGIQVSVFNKSQEEQDSVDRYLAQRIVDSRAALRSLEGETHLRVHGQTKYASIRANLLHQSERAGMPFWQGKVYLETRLVTEWGNTTKTIFVILHNDVPIGEISEFDLKAKGLLEFTLEAEYFGRAFVQDDLIGNIVHLFINPVNRLH
jgi:hypothetical protein